MSDATTVIVLKVKEFSLEMEKKFDFKPLLTDSQDSQGSTPLRIFSISTAKPENIKFEEEEMDLISGGSDVSSVEEIAQERNENPSHAWTEGNWAFRRDDMDKDLPSFEARYEAMKEIFPSLGENDGRSSRLETLKTPDGSKVAFGEADKNDRDELYAKLREAVDKRVSENVSRLSNPSLVSGDFLSIHENGKPKTAPSSVGKIEAEKQYFFPELRNLIEGRIEETKVDTLANRIERELMRRQHLCNEQALMLQMLMNRVQDLEKRGPPRRGATPVHTSSRASRGNRCMCYHTSNYIVEKATQTPSEVHDAEGVYVMVARNSGARAKKVQRRVAYGYPERVTEEKKVSALLSRKIVTQQIEFLPPIPEPYAKKRPRDTKKPGWHRV